MTRRGAASLATLVLAGALGGACARDEGIVDRCGRAVPSASGPKPGAPVVTIAAPALSSDAGVATARYETQYRDPVLEELRTRDKDWQKKQDEKTGEIRKAHDEEKEKKRLAKKVLKSSLPVTERPASPDQFEQVFHHPPAAQYYTGTCWSFATTSFLESEVYRLTKREVRLSEMATVYWEYLAKAARFVEKRGNSLFGEGSEANAVTRLWQAHGAWPLAAFVGAVGEDQRYDHQRMYRELKAVLDAVRDKGLWDEAATLAMLQVILDRHLGRPPERFDFDGQTTTPKEFMKDVLRIEPDAYVSFLSTLSFPFYTQGEFDVPDNWWHDASYYNVPLDEFYGALKSAIQNGYSLTIGLDVSEPGKDGEHDVMFVPDYDIPPGRIDQLAREYRVAHKVTTDDHGVHLVGHAKHGDHDWFLVKDSGRSSRRGQFAGYYFVRGDYVRLKALSFTVHRDAVAELLGKFEGE